MTFPSLVILARTDRRRAVRLRASLSATLTRANGRSKPAPVLEPAAPAVPTATTDKQYYDDDDQKSCAVHNVLLITVSAIPKIKKGHPADLTAWCVW
jgi:hypothetical protein